MRLGALLALPIVGTFGWALVWSAGRVRRGPTIDRDLRRHAASCRARRRRSPSGSTTCGRGRRRAGAARRRGGHQHPRRSACRPHLRGDDDGRPLRLHMRRVAADANLTAFERDAPRRRLRRGARADDRVAPAAPRRRRLRSRGRSSSGGSVPRRWRGTGPIPARRRRPARTRWSPARLGLGLLFALGLVGVFRNVGPLFDVVPILGIWAFFTRRAGQRLADGLVVSRPAGARAAGRRWCSSTRCS